MLPGRGEGIVRVVSPLTPPSSLTVNDAMVWLNESLRDTSMTYVMAPTSPDRPAFWKRNVGRTSSTVSPPTGDLGDGGCRAAGV